MGYLANIINDARRSAPTGLFAEIPGYVPTAAAPLVRDPEASRSETPGDQVASPVATTIGSRLTSEHGDVMSARPRALPAEEMRPVDFDLPPVGGATTMPAVALDSHEMRPVATDGTTQARLADVEGGIGEPAFSPVTASTPAHPGGSPVDVSISQGESIAGTISPMLALAGLTQASVRPRPTEKATACAVDAVAHPSPERDQQQTVAAAIQSSPGRTEEMHQPEAAQLAPTESGAMVTGEEPAVAFATLAQTRGRGDPEIPNHSDTPTQQHRAADAERPAPISDASVQDPSVQYVTPSQAAVEENPELRIWSREQASPRHKVSEPQVHIGRVDIVVLAAEPPRQGQVPTSTGADLASRLYLRRL